MLLPPVRLDPLKPIFPLQRSCASSFCSTTIQWVRKCEKGSTIEKVGIFFLKAIAAVLLFLSVIGIPFYLALHKEYQVQKAKEAIKHLPISSQDTKGSLEAKDKLAALKEMYASSEKDYLRSKKMVEDLESEGQKGSKEILIQKAAFKKILPENTKLFQEVNAKKELLRDTQKAEEILQNKRIALSKVHTRLKEEIEDLSKQVEGVKQKIQETSQAIEPLEKQVQEVEEKDEQQLRDLDENIEYMEILSEEATDRYFKICRKYNPQQFTFSDTDISRSAPRHAKQNNNNAAALPHNQPRGGQPRRQPPRRQSRGGQPPRDQPPGGLPPRVPKKD